MTTIPIVSLSFLIIAATSTATAAQELSPSARIAAARFAFTGAFKVDSTSAVVIAEPGWMRTDVPNVRTISPQLSIEAAEIARAIGGSVGVVRAESVLECIRKECAAAGPRTVVAVSSVDNSGGQWTVMVRAWMPSKDPVKEPRGTTVGMVVEVRPEGSGWRVIKALLGPSVAPVRNRNP